MHKKEVLEEIRKQEELIEYYSSQWQIDWKINHEAIEKARNKIYKLTQTIELLVP